MIERRQEIGDFDRLRPIGGKARNLRGRRKSRGLRKQLGDRDPVAGAKLGNVLRNVVTERELPVLRKQQNGRGRKLSGEAAGVELRVRRHGYVFVEVGEPKAARVDDPAVLDDSDGEAGRAPRMDLRLRHLVDAGGKRLR